MDNVAQLFGDITANISILRPPKRAIVNLDFSISYLNVTIVDDEKLNLKVTIDSDIKDAEYESLQGYWIDTKRVLLQATHPALKAKAAFELRYAVAMYDRTITADGLETKPRAAVLEGLEKVIDHFTSQQVELPKIKRYEGRKDPQINEPERILFHEGLFLCRNKYALSAMIFSKKDEIKRIYVSAPNSYSTELQVTDKEETFKLLK